MIGAMALPSRIAFALASAAAALALPPLGACAAAHGASSTAGASGDSLGLTSGGSGGGLIDSACAKSTAEAKNVPVDMYIMFDKSGSMAGPKWSGSTAALQAFFEDPKNAGLGVALRFFPDGGCDTSCNVGGCATPKVPLGKLTDLSAPTDAQEQKLLDAFVDVTPGGGTPLSAALDGAILWAKGVQAQAPGDKAVVVLVTDGEPTDCVKDGGYLVGAAKAAHDQNGIVTFAVGLEGSSQALMDQIAAAGGSDKSIVVGTANAAAELQTALDAIRQKQVACDYAIPPSSTGEPVDPSKVNVIYYPGSGKTEITIGQVPFEKDCGSKAAWHYDKPDGPTKIRLCPSACQSIQADTKAKIQIVFGCGSLPA